MCMGVCVWKCAGVKAKEQLQRVCKGESAKVSVCKIVCIPVCEQPNVKSVCKSGTLWLKRRKQARRKRPRWKPKNGKTHRGKGEIVRIISLSKSIFFVCFLYDLQCNMDFTSKNNIKENNYIQLFLRSITANRQNCFMNVFDDFFFLNSSAMWKKLVIVQQTQNFMSNFKGKRKKWHK